MKYAHDIFSYWIITWFIIYIILKQYNIYILNPKFALILGLVANMSTLMMIIIKGNSIKYILKFAIIIIITKLLPLYFVYDTVITHMDIIATILLFIIYLTYVLTKYKKPVCILKNSYQQLINGQSDSPLMTFMNKLF
jgi:Ca2+/Na+ antiporter